MEAMQHASHHHAACVQQGKRAAEVRVCCILQVVMSEGGYNSALDMWSLGCIFGELLQRVPLVGSATTPQLTVAPLFAIHGLPKTPREGYELAHRCSCHTCCVYVEQADASSHRKPPLRTDWKVYLLKDLHQS